MNENKSRVEECHVDAALTDEDISEYKSKVLDGLDDLHEQIEYIIGELKQGRLV